MRALTQAALAESYLYVATLRWALPRTKASVERFNGFTFHLLCAILQITFFTIEHKKKPPNVEEDENGQADNRPAAATGAEKNTQRNGRQKEEQTRNSL